MPPIGRKPGAHTNCRTPRLLVPLFSSQTSCCTATSGLCHHSFQQELSRRPKIGSRRSCLPASTPRPLPQIPFDPFPLSTRAPPTYYKPITFRRSVVALQNVVMMVWCLRRAGLRTAGCCCWLLLLAALAVLPVPGSGVALSQQHADLPQLLTELTAGACDAAQGSRPVTVALSAGWAEACGPARKLDLVLNMFHEKLSDVSDTIKLVSAALQNYAAPCVTLYVRGDGFATSADVLSAMPEVHRAVILTNVGRDSLAYLMHILDNYDSPAQHTIFLQVCMVVVVAATGRSSPASA